jgi:hypothetical protein
MERSSKLDGVGLKRLQDALLDAFPSWNDLAQMVRFGLGERLEQLVARDSLSSAVFALIEWAESRGQLDVLIASARSANPGNPRLQAFQMSSGAQHAPAPQGVNEIFDAAVRAGLTGARSALLSGIDPAFVANLPTASTPGAQLLGDLHGLRGVRLSDGSAPLTVWLTNAINLSGPRIESNLFRQALAAQTAGLNVAAAGALGAPASPAQAAAAPAVDPPQTILSRRAVRNLVNTLIRTDSELTTFCVDFFETVYAHFSAGMDRVTKVDLLITHAPLPAIVAALRESYPGGVEQHTALLVNGPSIPSAPSVTSMPVPSPPEVARPLLDPALNELLQAYTEGNLIVCAGAGVSTAAGLPSWRRLVQILTEHARSRGASELALAEIADLVAKERFIDVLSALKAILGTSEFRVVIGRHFNDGELPVPEIAGAIAGLAPRLRAVLTTNIDHLLERAFAGAWPSLARATGDIAQRRRYILKLHGTLLDSSTWVFTRDEYDGALYADPKLQSAFSALFYVCPILFVGYELGDDDFDQVLGRVRALAGDQAPRHFALVAAEKITPSRKSRFERAGVRLIAYGNGDGNHDEVARVLRWLAKSG